MSSSSFVPRCLTASWPIVSYVAYAVAYTIIQKKGLFEQYKIAASDPSEAVLIHACGRCLLLQTMHSCIEYFFGDDHMYSTSSSGISTLKIFGGMLVVDTYQYFAHRTLHAIPWLYRHVHKDHHKYHEPFSFSGLYNSFAESLVCDAGCIICATLVCHLTASESMILATLASAKTVSDHCGYMIPYDPFTFLFSNNAAYHRHHHCLNSSSKGVGGQNKVVAFQQPFFTFWDYLLDTYPPLEEDHLSTRTRKKETICEQPSTTSLTDSPTLSKNHNKKDIWCNFERLVCLNLEERPDRLQHAKQQFKRVGIADRVQYNSTKKSPRGGCFGCMESHWRAIQQAHKDGLKNLVIFEDDLVFTSGWQQVVSDCNDFVVAEPDDDWEYLNMNGPIYLYVQDSCSNSNIINGKSTKAHAICLSHRGMQRVLELYPAPANVGVDDVYMSLLSNTYCHKQSNVIHQLEELGTDNPWCFFDTIDGMEADYKAYIQTVYLPAMCRALSVVNLHLLGRFLPWSWRPWLISQGFSEHVSSDICVYRNGAIERFPWKVSAVGELLVTCLGLGVALTVPVPKHLSRVKVIWYLMKID